MTREEKNAAIEDIKVKLENTDHFYLADISGLNAEETGNLRRKCFENDIELKVVKNTLLKIAFEKLENYEEFYDILKGNTSIMFTSKGNAPGKLIKEFRKKMDKPILKGAFVEEGLYLGDDKVEVLASIKSKEEVIADIVQLLQSPMKNVISSLDSGSNILAGVIETLTNKEK